VGILDKGSNEAQGREEWIADVNELQSSDRRELAKQRTLKKILVVIVLMFGFGFSMIPFYRKICEVTGVNRVSIPGTALGEAYFSSENRSVRVVTLQLDATEREGWRFKPLKREVTVHLGELVKLEYEAENTTPLQVKAQAIPSYSPVYAQQYFRKLECFCFRQQWFKPHEKKRLPVVLRIDPALPKEVSTITLSYTLFRIEGV
jgi:cytochrome c oxidase assembly protein subunit 11